VNQDDFSQKMDDGNQHLFVSKPARYISYWISSANSKEPLINSLERFIDFSKMEMNCP
jgi:hypothetical protein